MTETRREFLDTLLFTSLAATALALAAPIPFYLRPPHGRMRRNPAPVGPASGLGEGQGRNVTFGGEPAVVVRIDGKVVAFSRICTHRNCAVNWDSARARFLCPCHGAVFDPGGKPVKGPATRPLEPIPCRVDERGEIVIGG